MSSCHTSLCLHDPGILYLVLATCVSDDLAIYLKHWTDTAMSIHNLRIILPALPKIMSLILLNVRDSPYICTPSTWTRLPPGCLVMPPFASWKRIKRYIAPFRFIASSSHILSRLLVHMDWWRLLSVSRWYNRIIQRKMFRLHKG